MCFGVLSALVRLMLLRRTLWRRENVPVLSMPNRSQVLAGQRATDKPDT
jgi:hypothetical protein